MKEITLCPDLSTLPYFHIPISKLNSDLDSDFLERGSTLYTIQISKNRARLKRNLVGFRTHISLRMY